jgi:hypothetical protein|tara:strand:+ start:2141 stop:2365 length:225 start_codon:yes stop_codon:yes gene_type:complete
MGDTVKLSKAEQALLEGIRTGKVAMNVRQSGFFTTIRGGPRNGERAHRHVLARMVKKGVIRKVVTEDSIAWEEK